MLIQTKTLPATKYNTIRVNASYKKGSVSVQVEYDENYYAMHKKAVDKLLATFGGVEEGSQFAIERIKDGYMFLLLSDTTPHYVWCKANESENASSIR